MSIVYLYVISMAVFQFVSASCAINYCNIVCDWYEDITIKLKMHTMCLFEGRQANCNELKDRELTQEEKKLILETINKIRSTVALGKEMRGNPGPQPPARNMRRLLWDDELQLVAQTWADQCVQNVTDKCRDVERFQVGQIVAFRTFSKKIPSFKMLIHDWWNQVNHFDGTTVVDAYRSPLLAKPSTAYTQLVWARSSCVGCGRYLLTKANGKRAMSLICNFGPAGNRVGKRIYNVGTTCAHCLQGLSCIRNDSNLEGLCDSIDSSQKYGFTGWNEGKAGSWMVLGNPNYVVILMYTLIHLRRY